MITHEDAAAHIGSSTPTRLVLSYEGDGGTPILDAARVVAAHWRFVLLMVMACAGAGVCGLLMLTPSYRVQAQYAFAADASAPAGAMAGRLGGLAALAGLSLGSGGTTHAEVIAKLRSRRFVEQFIRQNSLLETLFAGRLEADGKTWKKDREPTIADGFKKWTRTIVEVSEDKATGLLKVDVEWRDPQVAAAWCVRLVEQLNREMRADAIARADASLRYLNERLERTSSLELQQGLYTLVENTTRERMMAEVSPDYALRAVDPPVAPEQDEEVWPRGVPLIGGGILGGFLLSVAVLAALRAARLLLGTRIAA